jgi:hypothetical protein
MCTPETSTIASELDIPYKDWNRVHLKRKVSKPRRSCAIARGRKYTAHELHAIEVLKSFCGGIGGSDAEVDSHGQINGAQIYGGHVPARIVDDEARQALACERCPLILPGMPHYWGVVDIDLDG